MKLKTFTICWLPTFIIVFALNGVFHGLIAANFFDSHLSQLAPTILKMKDTNPLWVGLLDLIITFGMTYFVTIRQTANIGLGGAAFAGGLINFISAGAWNFVNSAMFHWSDTVTIGDLIWHISLGAMGGCLIATIYNKLQKNAISVA